MQNFFHTEQTLGIFFLQFCNRNASPVRYDYRNFFFGYDFCFCAGLTFPLFGQFLQLFPFLFFLIPILCRFFILLRHNSRFFFFAQPFNFLFQRLYIRRSSISLQPHTRCCFINEVNGFIRQEPVCNIATRQFYRSLDSRIGNLHIMMRFILVTNPFQNFNGILLCWLAYGNRLKSSL